MHVQCTVVYLEAVDVYNVYSSVPGSWVYMYSSVPGSWGYMYSVQYCTWKLVQFVVGVPGRKLRIYAQYTVVYLEAWNA